MGAQTWGEGVGTQQPMLCDITKYISLLMYVLGLYSPEAMKNYRALEAHRFFMSGHVRESICNKIIINIASKFKSIIDIMALIQCLAISDIQASAFIYYFFVWTFFPDHHPLFFIIHTQLLSCRPNFQGIW